MKRIQRYYWNWKDDVGEAVAVIFGLLIMIAVCAVAWMAVIEIEEWFR